MKRNGAASRQEAYLLHVPIACSGDLRHFFQDLSEEDVVPEVRAEPGGTVIEGYLYKRASNAFKTWSR